MTASSHGPLIVLLHGVAARGSDLAWLGAALGEALPEVRFAAPDAPDPSDAGPGRQWLSVVDATPANRPQRVVAARPGFDRTLAGEIDRAGLTDQLGRVALVGFSQGAMMALDALASGRWPVAAVVSFCGRLASPDPLTPAKRGRALLVHGESDPVIPARESLDAAARLRRASVTVECHIAPGLGHAIAPEGVALAATFLKNALAR